MKYKNLRYEKEDGIATVTMNRPETLNALSREVFIELYKLFSEIEEDEDVRLVILTGAGDRAFNAGADMDLTAALDFEERCFNLCYAPEDQKEGMKAFLEKRKPVFRNK